MCQLLSQALGDVAVNLAMSLCLLQSLPTSRGDKKNKNNYKICQMVLVL